VFDPALAKGMREFRVEQAAVNTPEDVAVEVRNNTRRRSMLDVRLTVCDGDNTDNTAWTAVFLA
jgi:hypothetical protein